MQKPKLNLSFDCGSPAQDKCLFTLNVRLSGCFSVGMSKALRDILVSSLKDTLETEIESYLGEPDVTFSFLYHDYNDLEVDR